MKMKNKIVYTYTYERLNEFKIKKDASDHILTAIDFTDTNNPMKFEITNKYFVDISNLYKSNMDSNNILIEKIMHQVYLTENAYVILNENSKNKFGQDFAASFDKFEPIQSIYEKNDVINNDFINIDEERWENLKKTLTDDLIGHNEFKKDFLNKLKVFPILYKLGEMKIFSILLCGKPGVGKTELARIIHKTMYKDSKIIKINLGNYKTQGALNSLIGSPLGFIGSERGGELSNKIRNSDSKVILIDEFEKADTDIFNFFYELLEDGKFTDLTGNEYDLNGYIIIFTTNLSKENYKEILPSPLLSRFTLKSFFESPNYSEKQAFIEKRINDLLHLYKKEKLQPEITYEKIKNNLDNEKIKKISDYRVINRIILSALTKTIDEEKMNNLLKYDCTKKHTLK